MSAAIGWGALAASSLVLGALLAFARRWPDRQVGLVLAFGAGALISAVSFELAAKGVREGGVVAVAFGLAAGALTYFVLNRRLERRGAGVGLVLGAFLDGIPEQLVLGIGIAAGDGVSLALLVAIFVSNLPEAIGSASEMAGAGRRRGAVVRLWCAVAVCCAAATVAGWALADQAGGRLLGAIDGFAAGALLVMLVDEMVPQARQRGGQVAGLVTVLGFAVAAGLSSTST
jgi:zinc transporter, ZIP family